MTQMIDYSWVQLHIATQTKTARTGNPGGGGSIGQSPTEGGLLMGDNHVLSPILATHSESDKHSHADRVVLALRYPSRADAAPIASVSKVIAGRVYLLAVYDADILAALVRMGWEVA